jgi:hypothetical protein
MAKDTMIPLQFPVERYIYGTDPDLAHWTSSPVWSQAVFYRNNPKQKYAKANPVKGSHLKLASGKKKKVPEHIEKTSRKAASHLSAIGKKGKWPIGDLYHARLALIYVMSPSNAKVRSKVIAAVEKHYPEYDWQGWLEKKERALEKKHERQYRAAANPDDRMFTISRGNPQGTIVPMPDNAGPFLPDMFPYGVGGRPRTLENPSKKYVKVK